MKRILLLATGGTIEAKDNGEGLAPAASGESVMSFVPKLKDFCETDCESVLNLDSTNIRPKDWRIIAERVFRILKSYDGVVITHGTDTMAYTAAMLSFMLVNVGRPVILTGSQKPLSDPLSDGRGNLLDAFKTAAFGTPGVYVVFGGKIIDGVRARKVHTTDADAFDSINAEASGHIKDGEVVFYKNRAETSGGARLDADFDENVALIKLIPGTKPEVIDALVGMGYKGIVIEAFGSGGLPFLNGDLTKPVRRAVSAGVSVVVITQCDRGQADLSLYEVGTKALSAGAICGYDMTGEAAVTKLMWALSHARDSNGVKAIMHKDYCGEICINY